MATHNMDRRRFLGIGTSVTGLAAAGLLTGCSGGGGGANANTIKVVSSLPRTGYAQGQTDSIVNGIRMAIEEYNGKVGNFAIEYIDWDDATAAGGGWTAEAETANAQKAIADPDVMAYIGPYNSGAAEISMPLLNAEGLVQVTPGCTWPGLTKPGFAPGKPESLRPGKKLTFFRVVPGDDVQVPVGADFARGQLKCKTVYLLDDTQVYGKGIADLFDKVAKDFGLTVLGRESVNERANDFRALMEKIKGTNPDLVYFGGTTMTKGGQIAKDMVSSGLKCPLMVPDGCYEQSFITSAGAENLNGRCYVTFGGVDPSKLEGDGKKFVENYKAKYGKVPESYAIYGYEAAKVVLEAIKKAGAKDREAIRAAVQNTKDFDQGAIGKWSFDANGDTTEARLTVSAVEGGGFKPKKEYGPAEVKALMKK